MRSFLPVLLLFFLVAQCSSLNSTGPHEAATAWFNGANIPWNSFGYDIGAGAFNADWFESFFTQCQQNHVNSARFWLHCDGRASPTFNSDGSVKGLSSTFLSDLDNLVNMARKFSVVLVITLWSFDMFKGQPGMHADLVSDASKTQSYIDNALIPIIKSLEPYENVIYEIMNEPEWAIQETPSTTQASVPLIQMQRFHGMLAEAIHKNSATKIVTTGSACLKWDSAAVPPALGNWWNDSSLKAGYSSSLGYLDFYQIHYYDWMYNSDWGYDPCREDTNYWKMDKWAMVGELPSDAGAYYTPEGFMDCTYKNGFMGTLFWAYNADWPWTSALPGLNDFWQEHQDIASYSALVTWSKSLRASHFASIE